MFVPADSITKNTRIKTDICIIGGGAVGLAMAQYLNKSDTGVVVLESGNLNLDEQTQKLNQFETDALPISVHSRRRAFGGTTKVWYGRWKPADNIDFKNRAWVPNSGWPITNKDLEPYYELSAKLLGTPISNF